MESVHEARMAAGSEMGEVEAPLRIIKHFLKSRIKDVEKVGYFIMENVKVYEEGRMQWAKDRDALTSEDIAHGKAKK